MISTFVDVLGKAELKSFDVVGCDGCTWIVYDTELV